MGERLEFIYNTKNTWLDYLITTLLVRENIARDNRLFNIQSTRTYYTSADALEFL